MHTVHFYSFRVLTKKGSRESFKLGNLGLEPNVSGYDIVKSFFDAYKNDHMEYRASKSVISMDNFSKLSFVNSNSLIYGYLKVGKFGEVAEIKEKQSQKTKYTTKVDDVVFMDRYVLMYLPSALDEGFVAIHSNNNLSARTIMFDKIKEFIKQKYNLEVRFNPLQHKRIPDAILDAELSEIKAIGFRPALDIADASGNRNTHIESDLIIKNHNGMFGSLRNIVQLKDIGNIIEVIESNSDEIKVYVKIGNRNVIFNYQSLLKKGVSIELDDNNIKINELTGVPDLATIHKEVVSISNELLLEIHSNNTGVKI